MHETAIFSLKFNEVKFISSKINELVSYNSLIMYRKLSVSMKIFETCL